MDLAQLDLVTPDGKVTEIERVDEKTALVSVRIENIYPNFIGYEIEPQLVFFNIKSTLAQIGLNGIGEKYELDANARCAKVTVRLHAIGPIAR